MGKGDVKTRRGKIFRGSYGNARRKKRRIEKSKSPKKELVVATETKSINNDYQESKWFKPKQYLHFSKQLDKKDKSWIYKLVSNKNLIARHNFFPLIHRTLKQRRYKKLMLSDGYVYRGHYDYEERKSTTKTRHIFYANHLDSMIYAYYAKEILAPIYEIALGDAEVSDCVSAYRKIETEKDSNKGKSNIHFAKDIFEYIKTKDECVAIALDITGFFDNLNHQLIKESWSKLLGEKNGYLPPDHFRIYQSLVNFSFAEENSLLYKFDLIKIKDKKKQREKAKKLGGYFRGSTREKRNRFFRKEICAKKFLQPHQKYEEIVKGKDKGIPQGLPISAFLANLYLFEFDKLVQKEVTKLGGLYRRYSDDIIVVCPKKDEKDLSKFIRNLIHNKFHLTIQPEKTETSYFKRDNTGKLGFKGKPLRYLGFKFDGENIFLKSSALAKYHRRKKGHIKGRISRMEKRAAYTGKKGRLWTSVIKTKYSDKGKRNFISYAKKAAKIMDEPKIKGQIKRHQQLIKKYIIKKGF